MDAQTLAFFDNRMDAIPMFEKLKTDITAQYPDVRIKVSKSQISFSLKYGFAFVSFQPCRKAKDRPAVWMTVSFGLGVRKESPRIDMAVEPYPGRWTHHVMVGSAEEIDNQLISWIREAADFSANKR